MADPFYLAAPLRDARVAEALRDRLTARNCPVQLWIAPSDTEIAEAFATHDHYSAVFSSGTADTDVANAARHRGHEATIERLAVIASSPIVLGWSREAAEHLGGRALGWRTLVEQSERADFRIVHASGADPTGRWALAALAKATRDAGDANGDLLRRIQSRTAGYAVDDLEIGDLLLEQPADAFVAQEDAALSACLAHEGRYVISMPEEGTFLVQRPLLVARVEGNLNEPWLRQQIELFDTLVPFLSSSDWYSALSEAGYRDPEGRVTPAAALPHYVAPPPRFPSYWEAPTAAAMAAIPALWADVKRPASILLLLDTSGSMSGGKLAGAKKAIRQFLVNILGAKDRLGLMTFGSTINDVVSLQPARAAAERIEASLDQVAAAGSTVLFDSVGAAIEHLEADGGTNLRAVVLLSDGADTDSALSLAAVVARIRDADHLLMYAVSYPDGSQDTLSSLASAGMGHVLQSDPQSIVRVYETISRRL